MTEHTPGVWHTRPPQGRARLHGVFSDDNYCLAECMGQEATANARLIAAAPDMLEALQSMNQWYVVHGGPSFDLMPCVQDMRAAIAKATGHDQTRD